MNNVLTGVNILETLNGKSKNYILYYSVMLADIEEGIAKMPKGMDYTVPTLYSHILEHCLIDCNLAFEEIAESTAEYIEDWVWSFKSPFVKRNKYVLGSCTLNEVFCKQVVECGEMSTTTYSIASSQEALRLRELER